MTEKKLARVRIEAPGEPSPKPIPFSRRTGGCPVSMTAAAQPSKDQVSTDEGRPSSNSPSIEHVCELVREAHAYGNSVPVAADVPKTREEMIAILQSALLEASKLAEQAAPEITKGSGGISPKIQYYRVIGYIAHVLDGICENVELTELNQRLVSLEKELGATKPTPNERGYSP